MAEHTPNLGLLKKDPLADGNETFNIETMLNDNWDKIDEAVGQVREELENVDVDIPNASLTEKGIVQLSNATNGTREDVAATEKAVKAAYDRGSEGLLAAVSAQSRAESAYLLSAKSSGYGTTINSSNAYSVNLNPAPSALTEGLRVTIKINTTNTGPATINVNGLGAKTIRKGNGNTLVAGNLKASSIYTLVYNGMDFILQGEGGGGTAQPEQVEAGFTFTNDSGEQIGTLNKQAFVDAIVSKGVGASINDTFPGLVTKIRQIRTGNVIEVPYTIASEIQGVDRNTTYTELATISPGWSNLVFSGTVSSTITYASSNDTLHLVAVPADVVATPGTHPRGMYYLTGGGGSSGSGDVRIASFTIHSNGNVTGSYGNFESVGGQRVLVMKSSSSAGFNMFNTAFKIYIRLSCDVGGTVSRRYTANGSGKILII